jgi:hypothetical protein
MNYMSGQTGQARTAVAALFLGVLAGVAADLLLRVAPWGINAGLAGILLLATISLLERRGVIHLPPVSHGFLAVAVLCLLSFAWRDSESLNVFALLGALLALGASVFTAQGAGFSRAGSFDLGLRMVRTGIGSSVGILPLLFQDIPLGMWAGEGRSRRLLSVGMGVALAVPPIIVFGALFASADPIFNNVYHGLFAFDLEAIVPHLLTIGFVSWVGAGFARELLLRRQSAHDPALLLAGSRWGFTEIAIVLGAVNLMFLLFVVIQLRALFGGDTFVLQQTGLTYAEYARRGFFDLVLASALVLPLLLFAEWIGRRSDRIEERGFHALSFLLLFLLAIVLLSAVQRMRIYQLSYGLTEPRVYTMAFMLWLAMVFIWFGVTVLRGKRERFAAGAVVMAFLVLLGLHVINPDQLIARTNLARADQGFRFDAVHAASLSDDAMPVFLQALPRLPQPDRCRLLVRLGVSRTKDWRMLNLARHRVGQLLEARAVEINAWRKSCPPIPPAPVR